MQITSQNKKKFILITGSSSGIGRCIAVKLSARYNVILNGRRIEKLQETKSLCSDAFDQLIFNFDLANLTEIENNLSAFIKNNDIEISHLIHCAGYMKMIPVKMLTIDAITSTFTTNVFSAFLLTKVLTLRKVNSSALENIVFISSNISGFGAKAFSLYAASKGALDSLMRCLAVELAPKIRVNSVLPGAIHTEMTDDIFQNKEVAESLSATYPLGLGSTEDIYETVDFLLSEKSRWITGQQFVVDGGRTVNIGL